MGLIGERIEFSKDFWRHSTSAITRCACKIQGHNHAPFYAGATSTGFSLFRGTMPNTFNQAGNCIGYPLL